MSIKLMVEVWQKQGLTSTEKLVLLALADWANDEGLCWPSIETLAQKTSLVKRSVSRIIKELERKQLLTRQEISGKGVKYWVSVKGVCRDDTKSWGDDTVSPNTTIIQQKVIERVGLPDWLPVDAWDGFVHMRKQQKKPLTDRAVQRIFEKLKGLREKGYSLTEVLDQSTTNCWSDVYEVKQKKESQPKYIQKKPTIDEAIERLDRDIRRWNQGNAQSSSRRRGEVKSIGELTRSND